MDDILKLPYGLRDNEIYTIDEVDAGLACNCVCPHCQKKLIARKGDKNVHHFAHYDTIDCGRGLETVLHQICKDIIFNSPKFKLPALYFGSNRYIVYHEREIPVDDVFLEKRFDNIIPDIIIECEGKKLLVEIVVTHLIDSVKQYKIEKQNIGAIAIDVRHLVRKMFIERNFRLNEDSFRKELISGTKGKFWIHSPKMRILKSSLMKLYAKRKRIYTIKPKVDDDWIFDEYRYVDDCPTESKAWKSGLKKGKFHADVNKHCNKCPFSIDFYENEKQYTEVACLGHLKSEFQSVLNTLVRKS